jgi:CRISPR system Cascade subunit CasD
MPLSYRFYLADAVFLAAIEGEVELLEQLRSALRRPVYPLFLGRRSCPPAGRLDYGFYQGGIDSVLKKAPWLASPWVQKNCRRETVDLDTVLDCSPDKPGADLVRDDPISFDQRYRNYGWRTVLRDRVQIPNPLFEGEKDSSTSANDPLDFMKSFEVIS